MSTANNDFKESFKKRCFYFSIRIIEIGKKLSTTQTEKIMFHQLLRSGTSIGANVVEGSNGSSKKEYINFFQIALKSASETLYWLALVRETNKDLNKICNELITECTEIKKLLTSIIINTKKNSKL